MEQIFLNFLNDINKNKMNSVLNYYLVSVNTVFLCIGSGGATFVFVQSGTKWSQSQVLVGASGSDMGFNAMIMTNSLLLVGAAGTGKMTISYQACCLRTDRFAF
jgi:hypothetical protein